MAYEFNPISGNLDLVSKSWIYDSSTQTYNLTISGTIVAIIDANGNLKIKGRVLKIT